MINPGLCTSTVCLWLY